MTRLAWHPWAVDFLIHFAALTELSFCELIWILILRPLVLLGAMVLHLGIGASLGLRTFSLILLVGCVCSCPARVCVAFGMSPPDWSMVCLARAPRPAKLEAASKFPSSSKVA